ncbi:MAG: BCCT family transporter [Neisseriaceae bacterium]
MINNSLFQRAFKLINPYVFFGSLFLLALSTLPLILYPHHSKEWIGWLSTFLSERLAVFYLGFGALSFAFVIYVACSQVGNIKLGTLEEEKEFSTLSWSAMLFCAGIGGTVLYWGLIEWAYYYQSPPFSAMPNTVAGIEWAATYGLFHWGPVAWAIYLIPAIPMAYLYHVKRQVFFRLSQCLTPLFGVNFTSRWLGNLIDILLIFGVLCGSATALGFVSPLITEGLHQVFALPVNALSQISVLLFTMLLFSYSAFRGLQKGIKIFSELNFCLALIFLLFVLCVGPTLFILNVGFESIGRSLTYLPSMISWNEAFSAFPQYGFKKTLFPQHWTVFYWAWWLIFSPTMGMFIARISRGRTIREMVVGTLFFGSLGCWLFFCILGNYGLYLHLSGKLDVIRLLNQLSPTAAIFAILSTLPLPHISIALFTVLAFVFTVTSFDSLSYILASVVQKNVAQGPARWNRLFWSSTLCLMPSIFLILKGDLNILQAATVIAAAPLLLILFVLILTTIKLLRSKH